MATAQQFFNYNGFTVSETPVLPPDEVHPSLYFSEDAVVSLQRRLDNNSYAHLVSAIRAEAMQFLACLAEDQDYASRPRMAKTLGFWYIMTGEQQALEGCINALMLAYEDVPQAIDLPYDEIRRATWLQNYCAAYDWVASRLSSEQDFEIRRRIAGQTQWLRDNLVDGLKMTAGFHNHRSKPAWAIATAALTLSENESAAEWLAFALKQQNLVTQYILSADGINREGGHYWAFTAVNFIPFLHHYYNVSGVDLFPAYQPLFEWPVRVRMGQGWIPNIEDGFLQPVAVHMAAGRYMNAGTDLHASAPLGCLLQWHFATSNIHRPDYTGATDDVCWKIDEFLLWDDSLPAVAPDASPSLMMAGGQVVLRSQWQAGPGHHYLLFHGVAEAYYHNHPDQLSFVIESENAYLITDAGYGGHGYGDARRQSWYVTPEAHNIVTANGLAPRCRHDNSTPATTSFLDSDEFDLVEKTIDFDQGYGVRQRRAVAFVDNRYWVVLDWLAGGESLNYFTSYLHGRGQCVLTGQVAEWSVDADKYGDAGGIRAYLFPGNGEVEVCEGFLSLFYDEEPQDYIAHHQTDREACYMQLLFPQSVYGSFLHVEDISSDGFQAARVEMGDAVEHVYMQNPGAVHRHGLISTDASFCRIREEQGELRAVSLHNASQWQNGDRLTLAAANPTTFAVEFHASSIDITTDSSTDDFCLAMTSTHRRWDQDAVRINGRPACMRLQRATLWVALEETSFPDFSTAEDVTISIETYPNPFTEAVQINIHAESFSNFSVDVLNQMGRVVAVLAKHQTAAGSISLMWDGCDSRHLPVASGVYFVRVRNAGGRGMQAAKLVKVRSI